MTEVETSHEIKAALRQVFENLAAELAVPQLIARLEFVPSHVAGDLSSATLS